MGRLIMLAGSLLAFSTPCVFGASEDLAAGPENMHVHEARDRVSVSWVDYKVPATQLVRADGKTVSFPKELDDGRPVVMNFIYTTCETICPLSSGTFSQFQAKLGAYRKDAHLVSISIDPEQDTPARLREYAKKFHAGPGWSHYTGTVQATSTTLQAFGVYWADKMSHTPVTLMRAAPGKAWMRIDGFVTPDQLLTHYHDLLAAR